MRRNMETATRYVFPEEVTRDTCLACGWTYPEFWNEINVQGVCRECQAEGILEVE